MLDMDTTQYLKTLHTQYGQYLRATLVRSLRADPLLVEAEEALHSIVETDTSQMFRGQIRQMLLEEPLPADVDDLTYMSDEREVLERFRAAMRSALRSGSSLTDAERELLSSFGFEKLGEFRSKMQSHLGGPAEIPEEDLAIYVSADEGKDPAYLEALRQQYAEFEVPLPLSEPDSADIAAITEMQLVVQDLIREDVPPLRDDLLPRWEPHIISPPEKVEPVEPEKEPVSVTEPISDDKRVTAVTTIRPEQQVSVSGDRFDFRGLNPVPRLTAALEAAGIEQDGFGFILRYGRYAAEGRRSDFLVGGLGLAELSNRLTAWLREHGPMDAQVQVVDEGSEELNIYLLSEEE
jgi:hypothetical protein